MGLAAIAEALVGGMDLLPRKGLANDALVEVQLNTGNPGFKQESVLGSVITRG